MGKSPVARDRDQLWPNTSIDYGTVSLLVLMYGKSRNQMLLLLVQQLLFLNEKLMVGLEHAPPSFDVRSRLLGPAVSQLKFIMSGLLTFLNSLQNSGVYWWWERRLIGRTQVHILSCLLKTLLKIFDDNFFLRLTGNRVTTYLVIWKI